MADHSKRFDHFELPAEDPKKLVEFYEALLDWKIRHIPVEGFDYYQCQGEGPEGINGAIVKRYFPGQQLTNYLTVEDIDAMLQRVVELGGTIVKTKKALAGVGYYALAKDPEGNPIGLWQKEVATTEPS